MNKIHFYKLLQKTVSRFKMKSNKIKSGYSPNDTVLMWWCLAAITQTMLRSVLSLVLQETFYTY